MRELIERLYREQTLAPGELRTLLLECRGEDLDFLMQKARAVAQSHFGNRIYIRGLIEIAVPTGCGNYSGLLPAWI